MSRLRLHPVPSRLSPSFCCPPSSVCIPLASNTTVLCCPNGVDCTTTLAIPCDISEQNNTLHPNSTVTTTALDVPLPNCGEGCCPFGYTCNSITAIRMWTKTLTRRHFINTPAFEKKTDQVSRALLSMSSVAATWVLTRLRPRLLVQTQRVHAHWQQSPVSITQRSR